MVIDFSGRMGGRGAFSFVWERVSKVVVVQSIYVSGNKEARTILASVFRVCKMKRGTGVAQMKQGGRRPNLLC